MYIDDDDDDDDNSNYWTDPCSSDLSSNVERPQLLLWLLRWQLEDNLPTNNSVYVPYYSILSVSITITMVKREGEEPECVHNKQLWHLITYRATRSPYCCPYSSSPKKSHNQVLFGFIDPCRVHCTLRHLVQYTHTHTHKHKHMRMRTYVMLDHNWNSFIYGSTIIQMCLCLLLLE